jgi:hypothetical protein
MARRKKTNEDQPQENPDNINESDDNFGLPEIEYKPLNREEEQEPEIVEEIESSEEVVVNSTEYEETSDRHDDHIFNPTEEESSNAPKIIIIVIVLALLGLGAWYLWSYRPKQRALIEKQKQEEARDLLAKQENDKRVAAQKLLDDEQRRADSIANAKPKIGTIETLTGRTGRYYVVVASAIDGDLLMDYAQKLSLKGINSQIIPPFGKVKFSRIAIASGDTYADAQSTADGLKSEYEGGAWVVKY